MFRRLRLQFITIASLAILFILVFMVGIINTVRSFQTEQEISKVLNTLSENNGSFGKTTKIEINQGREIPSDSFRWLQLRRRRWRSLVLRRLQPGFLPGALRRWMG